MLVQQSKWIELRDGVHERSYWVDLHSVVLQNLLTPIPLPDGRNPHQERVQQSWLATPPAEPACLEPYPGARPLQARARGFTPVSPSEAYGWLDLDHTTPDTVARVVEHYRERITTLGLELADDGWLHAPEECHRLVATTPDRTGQFDVTVHNFGPTTLIHTRYTAFAPGVYDYHPPALLELQIDHYDDDCDILYLQHPGDGQYFALSRYLIELCSQPDALPATEGELTKTILLPDWLPAYPGQRASVIRGRMPFSRARYLDLRLHTASPIDAVLDFYHRIAHQLELRILGESSSAGRRSLLAYDPKHRFRFEVTAAQGAGQTDVNLNYWEYPAPLEQSHS
ncbi:MAG: hypothetical protein K2X03_04010 [Bryobacteraceae bacterium]|nr:hypothetical protein [Bryobacteraceae bacterium]